MREHSIAFFPADKEGGFVVMPKGIYKTKALAL